MSCKDLSKLKILVADDSRPVRLVLKTYLGQLGFEPTLAENGTEALQKLITEKFDVAFMDVHMPEMNGTEVVSRIRNEGMTIPVFAMTTGDDAELLTKCLNCGYNSFLLKPIIKTELTKIISKLTDSH
ncbi:response regulator [Desulfovibrio gilichinskyi]|uniref:Two-component system, chemotaxis family, response regulator CheY n=1 Tax=Desulfovibrio gilichinskyi TaxID=1519643 RepID=A0A1X7CTJ0_9BACT|nr:response regulator [Desulfovibrio gilichinskyi]SMF02678.1 two-component system, chemotaxis family, response regulator CheY [Desulfovibrio gilichinskyi]